MRDWNIFSEKDSLENIISTSIPHVVTPRGISDVAYTSFLKRAIKTCWHTLEQTDLVRLCRSSSLKVLRLKIFCIPTNSGSQMTFSFVRIVNKVTHSLVCYNRISRSRCRIFLKSSIFSPELGGKWPLVCHRHGSHKAPHMPPFLQMHIPIKNAWQLNERHYGGLTGLDKQETVQKHGKEQVGRFRRY